MRTLSSKIAIFTALVLGGRVLEAQQCAPGTIAVWVAKGNSVEIGCTAVVLSTTPAKLSQNTLTPFAVLNPQYNQKGAASWTLQPSGDMNSTISSLNQAISDLQAAKKKDEATISTLQKQIADLQAKQSNQQGGQNSGQDQSSGGNDFDTSQGNGPQYHPPTYHPPTYHPPGSQSGKETESSNPVYAPFEVKSKTTGMVLFRVTESGRRGGRIYLFDSSGAEVASFGASETHLGGSVVVQTPDGGSHAGMGFNGNTGFLQIDANGKNMAELGPGLRSPMGLHIWNPSNASVVALEAMPSGDGGLWLGNAKGGTAATIAPNKDGVGIYHGITAIMPINHP